MLALTSFTLQAADGWVGTWKFYPSRPRVENTGAETKHVTAFTGTWKLNTAKSTYPPGTPPPPEGSTITLALTEDGTTVFTATSESGQILRKWSFPWSDGKDVPVEGIPLKNVTFRQKIQGKVVDAEMKADGKTLMTIHAVLSPDGKSHTGNITSFDEKGNQSHHIEVYDKQ